MKSPTVRDKFLVAPPKVGPGNSAHWDDPVGTDGVPLASELASTGVFIVNIEIDLATVPKWALDPTASVPTLRSNLKIYAFGRFNSESDFEGNYLGEVEINNSSLPIEVTL